MYANFKATWTTLTFLSQICSKRNLELEILKTNVGIRISIIEIQCAQIFRQNAQLWLFWPKFAQKQMLGLENQKTNVRIRISILEKLCVPIFRQNGQLWRFGLKFAQKWILGTKFQKINVGIRISILEIPCVPIFRQNRQLGLFGPKLAQKLILGSEFQKSKSGSESAPPRYHKSEVLVKMDNFEFFGLNFGKLPNYVRSFGSNIVEGVAESWVEAEMS